MNDREWRAWRWLQVVPVPRSGHASLGGIGLGRVVRVMFKLHHVVTEHLHRRIHVVEDEGRCGCRSKALELQVPRRKRQLERLAHRRLIGTCDYTSAESGGVVREIT